MRVSLVVGVTNPHPTHHSGLKTRDGALLFDNKSGHHGYSLWVPKPVTQSQGREPPPPLQTLAAAGGMQWAADV